MRQHRFNVGDIVNIGNNTQAQIVALFDEQQNTEKAYAAKILGEPETNDIGDPVYGSLILLREEQAFPLS